MRIYYTTFFHARQVQVFFYQTKFIILVYYLLYFINTIKLRNSLFLKLSAKLPQPNWMLPDGFQNMKSIFMREEVLREYYGNMKIQKIIIGKHNILFYLWSSDSCLER